MTTMNDSQPMFSENGQCTIPDEYNVGTNRQVRRNIWEVDDAYFCPIIGYCLTGSERVRIMKKFVKKNRVRLNEIELHEFLVLAITKETPVAKRIQKDLDAKYAAAVRCYQDVSYQEWLRKADEMLNPEDFGQYIWISALHVGWTKEQDVQIHGRIHMYTHRMLTDLRKCQLQLEAVQEKCAGMTDKLRRKQCCRRQAEDTVARVNRDYSELQKRYEETARELDQLKNRKSDTLTMRETIDALTRRLEEQKSINLAYRNENRALREKINEAEQRCTTMNEELSALFNVLKQQAEECSHCEHVDLCNKKVLLVGGLTGRTTFYRNLVEKLGGRFDHHDGCCGNGAKPLDTRILQSDVVICPVDINSHAACLAVKKMCKKERKDFRMLRKSSISSVYNTLVAVAGNG